MTDKEDRQLWKRYRRIIEREFLQTGTRLVDVIEYMATRHNFVRSKTQYERQLKDWGVRKKLTKSEWIAIISLIRRNSLSSSDIEISWRGSILLPEQVEREIKRYGSEVARQSNLLADCRRLPEHIEIRSRPSISPKAIARCLEVVHALPTRLRSVSPLLDMAQDFASFEIETIVSPIISNNDSMYDHFQMSLETPFSWLETIKSGLCSHRNANMQDLIRVHQPSDVQLIAAFYPRQHDFRDGMLYHIASLVNHMTQVLPKSPEELHTWLKSFPMTALVPIYEALPIAVFTAFREKLFVLAVTTGNIDIMMAMLELQIEPNEPLIPEKNNSSPIYPLEYAVREGRFFVARNLLVHMLRGSSLSLKTELFCQISIFHRIWGSDVNNRERTKCLRANELRELVRILLDAGAPPDGRCITVFGPDHSFIDWIQSSRVGLMPWLEIAVAPVDGSKPRYNALPAEHLRYLLTERLTDLQEESHDLGALLLRQSTWALRCEDKTRLQYLLPAVTSLGCRDDSSYASHDPTDVAYRQACNKGKWSLAASLMILKKKAIESEPERRNEPLVRPWRQDLLLEAMEREILEEQEDTLLEMDVEEFDEMLEAMVQTKYQVLTHDIPLDPKGQFQEWRTIDTIFKRALRSRYVRVATILHEFAENQSLSDNHLIYMLETGDASLCSELILCIPRWMSLLETVGKEDHVADSAAMMLREPVYLMMGGETPDQQDEGDIYRQLCLRVLSYHAIASDDVKLFKWCLHLGLDLDELYSYYSSYDRGLFIESAPVKRGDFLRRQSSYEASRKNHRIIPSVLSVVARQNNLAWIDHLQMEGVNMRDSTTLLWAVNSGANIQTIERLLQAANSQKRFIKDGYGSAALRQALRFCRWDVASLLCKGVELDTMECSTKEWLDLANVITPLGEAISTNAFEIAQWLLDHGADPNAYVMEFGTRPSAGDTDSYLPLETPLLFAINKRNLPMVKFLVGNGATIDDTRKSGLTRTPLQRATELGLFDFVQYFIDQNAMLDTTPAYSGGTALQLAAMRGHIGIATLLLERGADPNYQPARGDGRTAFEAAVEWGRVDMVALLMRAGIDLDLRVGDPPEAQYERARRFAENNGQFASKREAERLYAYVQAHRMSERTSASSLQVGFVDEMWSPGPMPEPMW